jgi:hypothetical protein
MGSFFMDPDGKIYSDAAIDLVNGSSAQDILARSTRHPDIPDTTSYVGSTDASGNASLVLSIEPYLKSPISTVVDISLYVYFDSGDVVNDSITTYLMESGYAHAFNQQISPLSASGIPANWYIATWTSGDVSQQILHDLRAEIKINRAGSSVTPKVYAAYIKVNTTETTLTFTAPDADSFTPASPRSWSPRIRPGAFWL